MRRQIQLAPVAVFAAACGGVDAPPDPLANMVAGRLNDERLVEASGVACTPETGALWAVNDSGSAAELFAANTSGEVQRRISVRTVANTDWEDLGWSPARGLLVIADIGDNLAARDFVSLHLLDAAGLDAGADIEPAASVHFRYPNGPRDAEALAIDPDGRRAYVLTKRTIPAELYAVPLDAVQNGVVTAVALGTVPGLPLPSDEDVRLAPLKRLWPWQPTAMEFAPDGRSAAILTYAAVYLYRRRATEDWPTALQRAPRRFDLGGLHNAEALCLSRDAVLLTVEAPQPPLYRIPLEHSAWTQLPSP